MYKRQVIHFTGNKGDTAKNNADFYATGNTREAGAHFFVDKKSEIWESVPMAVSYTHLDVYKRQCI